jgi:hypothetical protein
VAKVESDAGVINLIEYYTKYHGYVDVIALLSPPKLKLRNQAQHTHGLLFVEIWHEVLRRLGYDERTIRASDDLDAFFCNYWLAKPVLMLEYIEFLSRAILLLKNDTALASVLQADARYAEGSAEVAQSAFGTPFYQLHPFIAERLPIVFFRARNACVLRVRANFRG